MPGGVAAGDNDHQDIDGAGQIHKRLVIGIIHVGLPVAAVIGDLQAEGFGTFGDGLADAAETENAHCLAGHASHGQRIGLLEPLPGPQIAFPRPKNSRTVMSVRPIAVSATSSVRTFGVLVTTMRFVPA